MTMIFNGTELEGVRFNGVDCEKVYLNGSLVFEKLQLVSSHTMVVGYSVYSNGNRYWGFFGSDSGSLSPNSTPALGVIHDLYWYDASASDGQMIMRCNTTLPAKSIKVTIAGVSIVIPAWDYPASNTSFRLVLTPAQLASLPNSGTHSLKIEAIP